MNASDQSSPCEAACCPLCGKPNQCQAASTGLFKGPCWCEEVRIPPELIERVPPHLQGRACICPECVRNFWKGKIPAP